MKKLLLMVWLFVSLFVRPLLGEVVIDKHAPDFKLMDSSGKEIKLSDFSYGKVVILWVTNLCSGCQRGLLPLERLYRMHGEKVEFLAIVQANINTSEAQEIKNKLGISFPFLMDSEREVCKLYGGVDAIGICPLKNIFFIDRERIIREVAHYPGLAEEEMEKYLKLIL